MSVIMISGSAPARTLRQAAEVLALRVSADTAIRINEPLARKTTLRVGGAADLFIEPASEPDLQAALLFCAETSLPLFVLGRGSNLLVRDGGFRGMVLSLGHACFSRIKRVETRLECGAGARLKTVAQEAKKHSLTGLEFLEGIPGTLGGALRMNAGAMGGSTFEVVRVVRLMDLDGSIRECIPSDLKVHYRGCESLRNAIALSAVLEARPGRREDIERQMAAFSSKRWSSQPAAPSAGCMFKNPLTIPAGRLIDELGLKGTRCGGAMVSLEHGNFLVNDGTATAKDVLKLIQLVRDRARLERGIELETEVEIIGED